MGSKYWQFWIFIFIFAGLGGLSAETEYNPRALIAQNQKLFFPRFIAHQALVSKNFSANSNEAILEALKSPADGIEIEIQVTKDPQIDYQKIVEIFKLVGAQKFIFLKILDRTSLRSLLPKAIHQAIDHFQLYDSVVVESDDPLWLLKMRLESTQIMVKYDLPLNTNNYLALQVRRFIRPEVIGLDVNADIETISRLGEQFYPMISSTTNDPSEIHRLFNRNIVGVLTTDVNEVMSKLSLETMILKDGGDNEVMVDQRIYVKNLSDIQMGLELAMKNHVSLSIAGRRLSTGGQSQLNHSINLDLLGYHQVTYNSSNQHVYAQSGATWRQIQAVLDSAQRAVWVMPPDTSMTVGGSISVNANGIQNREATIGQTIVAMKVLTADGSLKTASRTENKDLFKAVIGGYGLFGVIVEAELETKPNSLLKEKSEYISTKDLESFFKQKILINPKIQLAFARLQTNPRHFLENAGVVWYEEVDESPLNSGNGNQTPLSRIQFHSFQSSDLEMELKSKNKLEKKNSDSELILRSTVMGPNLNYRWPLKSSSKEVFLQFFVPFGKTNEFLISLKEISRKFEIDYLDINIRAIAADHEALVPYVREDSMAIMLTFSQHAGTISGTLVQSFAQEMNQQVGLVGGAFFWAYKNSFSARSLLNSYPNIKNWAEEKKKWDPKTIFSNSMYLQILKALE